MALPAAVRALLEPALGVLADPGRRRALILGGGVLFSLAVALAGMLRSGWYATLEARLYGSLPGAAGTALALGNVAAVAGALLPLALSALAQARGLEAAMWLFLAGPLALLVGLPRRTGESA